MVIKSALGTPGSWDMLTTRERLQREEVALRTKDGKVLTRTIRQLATRFVIDESADAVFLWHLEHDDRFEYNLQVGLNGKQYDPRLTMTIFPFYMETEEVSRRFRAVCRLSTRLGEMWGFAPLCPESSFEEFFIGLKTIITSELRRR